MAEIVRIRVTNRRQGPGIPSEARSSFWAPLRETKEYSNQTIEDFESTLVHQFGSALRNHLIESVREEVAEFEKGLLGVEFSREFWRFFDHEFHFMRREKGWTNGWTDPIVKYFEVRQHALDEVPQFRVMLEKLTAAAAVRFSARIRGYGSLDLEVSVGAFERLAQVFDDNFDSFRVFLDCFVPQAFADVFNAEFASQLSYDIDASGSLESAFKRAVSTRAKSVSTSSGSISPAQPPVTQHEALKKAEWLWRLANGSLLIPFLLALAVLYFGFREFSSLRTAQYEALKPILEHQLQLLKEDRERLAADHATIIQRQPGAASQPSP